MTASMIARTLAVGTLALCGVFPMSTSGAADAPDECEQVTSRFVTTFPRIYRQADQPAFRCHADVPPPWSAAFDHKTWTIAIGDIPGAYERIVAHEVGHAWLRARHYSDVLEYARFRGFPITPEVLTDAGMAEVSEDYAETFAFALGWWELPVRYSMPPPYAFQTVAGPPTMAQIDQLRALELLPLLPSHACMAPVSE